MLVDGTFRGVDNSSIGITSFLGIRFADPPTGNNRWRAAVSPPSENLGTVDATDFADICASIGQTGDGTSEDCLFGNVFVPSGTTGGDNLPVVVWIHGGGFQSGGTPDFDPVLLMNTSTNPMIFASFAYRLGPLGFLGGSRLKEDGQLNIGIQDQRVALRWVQRYIAKFGGDPSRVTIWGQSGGAGSTMFHLLANGGDNEGLFHAAMGDSPSLSVTPDFDSAEVESLFDQFASFANCGTNEDDDVLDCLRATDLADLADAWDELVANRTSTLFNFAPISDGEFIDLRPVEGFNSGVFAKVPVLYGSNSDEGANWSSGLPDQNANTRSPNATETTVFNFLRGQWDLLTRASFDDAVDLYPLDEFDGSFDLQGQQMYGEVRYICTAGLITASETGAGVKAYQYHYDNPHLGSNHGAELGAYFPENTPDDADEDDLALFEAMREFITSFITTGTPTSKSAGVEWNAVTDTSNDGSPRILFSPDGIRMEVISDELNEHCTFWHSETLAEQMET
ncbi:alpha/beta-hydrolase [Dendrothele bispora CBS 962.96]|uniref:Carboxylic ester hydrolase n=1 Tax=Dendrothele bispora (strain CBS 962.96) TaxID=1314807 RepID=A0A4S8MRV8_DENBC|nr:alpha/beta-hydrolase [Dendrothele bispora CBS 962.96]